MGKGGEWKNLLRIEEIQEARKERKGKEQCWKIHERMALALLLSLHKSLEAKSTTSYPIRQIYQGTFRDRERACARPWLPKRVCVCIRYLCVRNLCTSICGVWVQVLIPSTEGNVAPQRLRDTAKTCKYDEIGWLPRPYRWHHPTLRNEGPIGSAATALA